MDITPVFTSEERESLENALKDTVIVPGSTYDNLVKENEELKQLEKQYARTLGCLAQVCDIVCSWVIRNDKDSGEHTPSEVMASAKEIMEYVNSVRP